MLCRVPNLGLSAKTLPSAVLALGKDLMLSADSRRRLLFFLCRGSTRQRNFIYLKKNSFSSATAPALGKIFLKKISLLSAAVLALDKEIYFVFYKISSPSAMVIALGKSHL
jgi:hypothetical protein